MDILESIGKTLGLDSLGKSLGLDWFKNAVPSFKKALDLATKNKDGNFLEKIGIFWTAFNAEKDKLDGEKKEIAGSTDEKVKATLAGITSKSESTDYSKINIPDGPSVVGGIKMRLKENKKNMVRLIESMFTERLKKHDKDLTDEQIRKIVIAALANSYGESRFNPEIGGDGGDSVGLFQLNKGGLGNGMYKAWQKELRTNPNAPDPRKDPVKNISKILDNVTGGLGRSLIASAKAGADIPKLIEIFVYKIENPAKPALDTQKRIGFAKDLFGEDLSSAPRMVATSAPAAAPVSKETGGKDLNFKIDLGGIKKGFCDIASGQKNWFFGSSSVVGTPKNMGGRLGVVSIGPNEFLKNLKDTWWNKIETAGVKMPQQIVITGIGQNGIGNSDASVKNNLDNYAKIKSFLEGKGTKVKFITIQPADTTGTYVAKFNTALKKQYGKDCIDATSATTESGGTRIADSYVRRKKDGSREGIHLNNDGRKLWNDIVLRELNEGQRTI